MRLSPVPRYSGDSRLGEEALLHSGKRKATLPGTDLERQKEGGEEYTCHHIFPKLRMTARLSASFLPPEKILAQIEFRGRVLQRTLFTVWAE